MPTRISYTRQWPDVSVDVYVWDRKWVASISDGEEAWGLGNDEVGERGWSTPEAAKRAADKHARDSGWGRPRGPWERHERVAKASSGLTAGFGGRSRSNLAYLQGDFRFDPSTKRWYRRAPSPSGGRKPPHDGAWWTGVADLAGKKFDIWQDYKKRGFIVVRDGNVRLARVGSDVQALLAILSAGDFDSLERQYEGPKARRNPKVKGKRGSAHRVGAIRETKNLTAMKTSARKLASRWIDRLVHVD